MSIRLNGEIHSSKNSHRPFVRNGRMMVFKSKASKADEKSLAQQLEEPDTFLKWVEMLCNAENMVNSTVLHYPLYVHFRFYRGTRRKFDYANLVQGVADALVKAEYLPDDDCNHFIPVFEPFIIDKENPGVEFWV